MIYIFSILLIINILMSLVSFAVCKLNDGANDAHKLGIFFGGYAAFNALGFAVALYLEYLA